MAGEELSVDHARLPPVTAVISTHNRCRDLGITLDALEQLQYPGLSTIVVDNDSDDDTRSLLGNSYPHVKLIPHADNKPLHGYNLGFSVASAPYVLVLDDDSCPRPGTIERMVGLLERCPDVGAAAANIIGPDGASEWAPRGLVEFTTAWDNLIGCGFLVRHSVLSEAHGYNEQFELYYNDVDLAIRIIALGHKIAYQHDWIVEHRRVPSNRVPHRKRLLMLRNFSMLVRAHFAGSARIDLLAGHAAIALVHAAREGCFLAGLKSLVRGFACPVGRDYLQAPDTAAVRRFIGEYSLTRNLARTLSGGAGAVQESPGEPLPS